LGTPPEDDAGAGEGVPEPIVAAKNSEHNDSLAARIDAFKAEASGTDQSDAAEPGTQSDVHELDEIADLEELPPSGPQAAPATPAIAPKLPPRPPIPPPRPVVAIPPPRPVAIPPPPRLPSLGKPPSTAGTSARPGAPPHGGAVSSIPPTRASTPNLVTIDIPPVKGRGAAVVVSIPSAIPAAGGTAARPQPMVDPERARKRPTDSPIPPIPERSGTPSSSPPNVDRQATPSPTMETPQPAAPAVVERESAEPYLGITPTITDDIIPGDAPGITTLDAGVEVGTAEPHVAVDQPLEAQLEHPTVVDKALAVGDTGGEARAEQLTRELEAAVLSDPARAAFLAYELGELYERRLADEARAVKAYGRALNLDPSLRANLWAIRRVFYRRELWPNLAKLVDAEVLLARDDYERADLLLEKARVHAYRMNDLDEARTSLVEAARIAPQHHGVLLELERVVAKAGDVPALLDVWERLAEAVEQPSRKIGYWLEVARTAASARELGRAHEAFDKAAQLATGTPAAERVARERLRVAEEHGTAEDTVSAIDALATILLAAFGLAGPPLDAPSTQSDAGPDRATSLRLELVALRRRQAQLVRASDTERAWELLQQASALAPGEPVVLADLTELAEELGRYDDLAELVQSWQAVEVDPSRAMALSIRRADALLRGGQRDQARALLASLEANAPGFAVLTSLAERDALSRGDVAELAHVYLTAAHAALLGSWLGPGLPVTPEPRAAAALYVQAAELLAYEVATTEAVDEARAALGKALEAVADHAAALEALTELDDTTGRPADALARLKETASRASADDKRALIERAIRLARGHGDLERVAELERELFAIAPDELVQAWRLESTLGQLGRDDERAELLVQVAERETDATSRGTALFAAARVRERAGNVEAATDLYRQVLALWPDDAFARESLVDLLRAQERWPELVAERRAEALAVPDGRAARRALREAALVLEIRVGDVAAAAGVYDDWLARMPDDRFALEGIARCRAALGDHEAEIRARVAVVEADGTAYARFQLASCLERAGKVDDAITAYRELVASDEPSVAVTSAALALADLATARNDAALRIEATASLVAHTADPRLSAALAEDSGWMCALVLGDLERAGQAFAVATEHEPGRRGALLGLALVASKSGDQPALARAYEGLAAALDMPEASAALLLRAAAIAIAGGELELANQRVAAARAAAPDDTGALLVVAETTMVPHVDSDDAFAAVDPLLARAEVLEMRGALADDQDAAASWELDRAEALELAGRLREAGAVIAGVLRTRPDDLRALSALRRMAKRAGDLSTLGQAAYALARVLGDHDAKLALLREAVAVFDGPGLSHNTDYAIAACKRILAVDPSAPELDRLLELLRERTDVRGLLAALTDRLTWLEAEGSNGQSAVPLLLERATVLHGLGDQASAMADLDALLEQAPGDIEALRFRAELAINAADVERAIALWRRYLREERRPAKRAEIELQLSQVLAENTGDLIGAIEQLERVVDSSPEDIGLREKLLGLCTRANDWERATRELRVLSRLRSTPQDKAREELRLALLLRDRAKDRVGARLALDRARTLDPLNLDVVRELSELLEPSARGQMLGSAAVSLRESIAQNPKTAALYERLAQINGWQSDVDARWVALTALEALGTPTADQRQVIAQGRAQLGTPGKIKLDDAARAQLRGQLGGPLVELWRAIAPAVQVATGVDPGKLGFARGDRVAIKKLGDKYAPLAKVLACYGLEDVELYISTARLGFARALAAETPIACLGADLAGASTTQQRFVLARVIAKIAEGVATLTDLREGELEWTIAAALRACEVPVPPALAARIESEDAPVAERAKLLKKELSRKARGTVQQLAQHNAAGLAEVETLRRHAVTLDHRTGLSWCGDLAVALAQLDVGKGGRTLVDSAPALELVAWSVSDAHLRLRERLGVALKVPR
jgi:tetratricopeptide (TPR) repeat protein